MLGQEEGDSHDKGEEPVQEVPKIVVKCLPLPHEFEFKSNPKVSYLELKPNRLNYVQEWVFNPVSYQVGQCGLGE